MQLLFSTLLWLWKEHTWWRPNGLFSLLMNYLLTHLMEIAVTKQLLHCWVVLWKTSTVWARAPITHTATASIFLLFWFSHDAAAQGWDSNARSFGLYSKVLPFTITNKPGQKKSEFQWRSLLGLETKIKCLSLNGGSLYKRLNLFLCYASPRVQHQEKPFMIFYLDIWRLSSDWGD